MKRKNITFLLVFLLVIVLLALLVAYNFDYLSNLVKENIGIYGYPAIFVFSFLSDSFDQPIGPEAVAGVSVLFGLSPLLIFFVAVAGSWSVLVIHLYIGRRFFAKKLRDACSLRSGDTICNLFKKYGKLEIMIAALTPVPFVSSCWAAGAFGMKLRDFFVFGMLPRALRIGVILLIVSGIISLG